MPPKKVVAQKKHMCKINSPKPCKTIKGKQKITNVNQRKLRRLKKDDLHELAALAGVNNDEIKNKNDLSHLLARNPKIASAFGAAGVVVLGGLGIALKKHFKTKKNSESKTKKSLEKNIHILDINTADDATHALDRSKYCG